MTVVVYAPHFPEGLKGAGEMTVDLSLALDLEFHGNTTESFGKIGKVAPKTDLFLIYNMGPEHYQSSVSIPKKSIINSAKLTITPSTSLSSSMSVRVMALDNVHTTVDPSVQTDGIKWSEGETTYGEYEQLWLQTAVYNTVDHGSSRIDDTGDDTVQEPGTGGNPIAEKIRPTGSPAIDGLHSVSQESKIVLFDGGGDAVFDRVDFFLGSASTATDQCVMCEVWSGVGPTGPDESDGIGTTGGGSLLATSNLVTLDSLSLNDVQAFDFDPPVNAGTGEQTLWFTVTSSGITDPEILKVRMEIHSGATVGWKTRLIGRSAGWMPVLYPITTDMPAITGPTDDILNGNEFGTEEKVHALGTWTAGSAIELDGLEDIIQSRVDDSSYTEGELLALICETVDSTIGNRSLYMSPHAVEEGARLEIDFTPPVGRRLRSHYGW